MAQRDGGEGRRLAVRSGGDPLPFAAGRAQSCRANPTLQLQGKGVTAESLLDVREREWCCGPQSRSLLWVAGEGQGATESILGRWEGYDAVEPVLNCRGRVRRRARLPCVAGEGTVRERHF